MVAYEHTRVEVGGVHCCVQSVGSRGTERSRRFSNQLAISLVAQQQSCALLAAIPALQAEHLTRSQAIERIRQPQQHWLVAASRHEGSFSVHNSLTIMLPSRCAQEALQLLGPANAASCSMTEASCICTLSAFLLSMLQTSTRGSRSASWRPCAWALSMGTLLYHALESWPAAHYGNSLLAQPVAAPFAYMCRLYIVSHLSISDKPVCAVVASLYWWSQGLGLKHSVCTAYGLMRAC